MFSFYTGCLRGVPQWALSGWEHVQRWSRGRGAVLCVWGRSVDSKISLIVLVLQSWVLMLTVGFLNCTITFEKDMVELCMQIFKTGLAEHHQRETEVNSFFSGQAKANSDYQEKASQILTDFDKQHRHVRKALFCHSQQSSIIPVNMLLIISIKIFHVFTRNQRRYQVHMMKSTNSLKNSCHSSFSGPARWR